HATASSAAFAFSLRDALPILLARHLAPPHWNVATLYRVDRTGGYGTNRFRRSGHPPQACPPYPMTAPWRCRTHNGPGLQNRAFLDRKSTRLNSSHVKISYAVF